EKSLRSNSCHRVWHLVDGEGGADDGRGAAKMLLPRAVAHDGHRRRARLIIARSNDTSCKGPETKCREVIARDEFTHVGFSRPGCAVAADAQTWQATLERRHLAEFGRMVAE